MLRKNFPGRKNRRREIAIKNLETAIQLRERSLLSLQQMNEVKPQTHYEEKIRSMKSSIKNLKNALADTKRNLSI